VFRSLNVLAEVMDTVNDHDYQARLDKLEEVRIKFAKLERHIVDGKHPLLAFSCGRL
jgi:hypothetical protein